MEVGLKLYSTDVVSIPDVLKLRKQGFFDYVELYIIPSSYKGTINAWKSLNVPFVIHAPHSFHGFNLAQTNMWKTNQRNFNEAQLFADSFEADVIIVHGGNNGSFAETLRQIDLLKERRIALENKPKFGLKNERCVGWSPSEFRWAVDAGFSNAFVLDFGHAVCAANSMHIDTMGFIGEFLKFKPKIFHLSDGDNSSEIDDHFNLGKGSLDIEGFLSVVPDGSCLTIETPRDPSNGLEDFVNDVCFLRNVFSRKKRDGKNHKTG